jgi:phage baseplate assembly protein W
MANIVIGGNIANINLTPASVAEEVVQNLNMLLATAKYSVPLDREFGISWESVDRPMAVAEAMIVSEIMEAVERCEPRAEIQNIKFARNELTGKLNPILEVLINDE